MVRDHVAVATVLVVSVALCEPGPGPAPVAVPGVPAAQVADHRGDDRVRRDVAESGVEELVGVSFDEGHRLHRGEDARAVHRFAVVADTRGGVSELDRQLGVARRDHRPAVDEDLGADLLRHDLAVPFHRAAFGRLDSALETKVSRVLGGVAEAAPPEHRALPDQVVEPGLADLPRAESRARAVILERPQKREGPRDVVVGDDQGNVEPVVNVVLDVAEPLLDPLVGPALEWSAEVDADDLAEDAGVDAVRIVGG